MLLRIGLGAPGKVLVRPFITKLYWAAMRGARFHRKTVGRWPKPRRSLVAAEPRLANRPPTARPRRHEKAVPARVRPPLPRLRPAGPAPMPRALRDAALRRRHRRLGLVEGLTTEVGQRLAGTEAEARARDWAVRRLTALGFAQRPRRAVRHAGLGARRGAGRDRLALPAAAGGDRARQQRRDAGARHRGRGGRLRQRRRARRRRPTRRCAARSSSSTTHARRPRTAPATASSARRGGRARRSPAARARSAIVVRSIGTDYHRNPHTGVQSFAEGVAADPGRRAVHPRRRAAPAHPARAAGRCGCG